MTFGNNIINIRVRENLENVANTKETIIDVKQIPKLNAKFFLF